jgi:hypothetical protein
LFLWRQLTVLDLPGGNVANQLGKLERVAGALTVVRHQSRSEWGREIRRKSPTL